MTLCLTACNNSSIDDASADKISTSDAIAIVDELIPAGTDIRRIFYVGLPTEEDYDLVYPVEDEEKKYAKVSSDTYRSIADIKTATEAVFAY